MKGIDAGKSRHGYAPQKCHGNWALAMFDRLLSGLIFPYHTRFGPDGRAVLYVLCRHHERSGPDSSAEWHRRHAINQQSDHQSMVLSGVFGTAVACLALVIISVVEWRAPDSAYVIAGSVLYLMGSTVMTMVCNVPLNNVLAAADPGSAEGDRIWTRYLEVWTMWNHAAQSHA